MFIVQSGIHERGAYDVMLAVKLILESSLFSKETIGKEYFSRNSFGRKNRTVLQHDFVLTSGEGV